MGTNITMIHYQTISLFLNERVYTNISLEMWHRHYVQLLYQAMSLFRHVRSKAMKPWVRFLQGCIYPPIQGIRTYQGQFKDLLAQLPFLISAHNVT